MRRFAIDYAWSRYRLCVPQGAVTTDYARLCYRLCVTGPERRAGARVSFDTLLPIMRRACRPRERAS